MLWLATRQQRMLSLLTLAAEVRINYVNDRLVVNKMSMVKDRPSKVPRVDCWIMVAVVIIEKCIEDKPTEFSCY